MSHIPLENRTIWITGASSGIGRSLAERLAGHGNHLVLTARNRTALEDMARLDERNVTVLDADLSSDDCIAPLSAALDALPGGLDTMLLCAGDCEYVDVARFDSGITYRMANLNLVGVARCLEAGLPSLRRSRKRPHIAGISSASALTGLPRAEAYGASKAALVNFLESLGLDLRHEGIDVSIVLPGFVDTPLTRRNDFPMPFLVDADTAARRIIDGLERRRIRIAFPRRLTMALELFAMLPDSLRLRLGQKLVRTA